VDKEQSIITSNIIDKSLIHIFQFFIYFWTNGRPIAFFLKQYKEQPSQKAGQSKEYEQKRGQKEKRREKK